MCLDINKIFDEIEKNEEKYIRFWEDICNIETVSGGASGKGRCAPYYR